MKRWRRLAALLLCGMMALVALPQTAYAEAPAGDSGRTAAGARAAGVVYLDEEGRQQTLTEAVTAVDRQFKGPLDSGWYIVSAGTIPISSRLEVTGDAHLILRDNSALQASKGIRVPEGKSLTIYGQSRTEDTMGQLTAQGTQHYGAAGIGGDDGESAGTITINGGRITATGGNGSTYWTGTDDGSDTIVYTYGYPEGVTPSATTTTKEAPLGPRAGAGIGGGGSGDGGSITINGGIVTATGAYNKIRVYTYYTNKDTPSKNHEHSTYMYMGSAGIGGGTYGSAGEITVNGGRVTATTGFYRDLDQGAAAIGGGAYGDAGRIIIHGGTVEATSGREQKYSTQPITAYKVPTIPGDLNSPGRCWGDTIQWSDDTGAAIGSGFGGLGGYIYIDGGTVNATAYTVGAAIGASEWSDFEALEDGTLSETPVIRVVIDGGDVTATAAGGAAIGTGSDGATNLDITINGGNIEANARGGAGIGSGCISSSKLDELNVRHRITINDGAVKASSWLSAAIGTGHFTGNTKAMNDDFCDIAINGGRITADADRYFDANGKAFICGAGIGGGRFCDGGNITITGGEIYAKGGGGAAGIGGGYGEASRKVHSGHSGRITITGAEVTAVASPYTYNGRVWGGAGIGGGNYGQVTGDITIKNAAVSVTGIGGAAGIGAGANLASIDESHGITVESSRVTIVNEGDLEGAAAGPGINGGDFTVLGSSVILSNAKMPAAADPAGCLGLVAAPEGGAVYGQLVVRPQGITSDIHIPENCPVAIRDGATLTIAQGARFLTESPLRVDLPGGSAVVYEEYHFADTIDGQGFIEPPEARPLIGVTQVPWDGQPVTLEKLGLQGGTRAEWYRIDADTNTQTLLDAPPAEPGSYLLKTDSNSALPFHRIDGELRFVIAKEGTDPDTPDPDKPDPDTPDPDKPKPDDPKPAPPHDDDDDEEDSRYAIRATVGGPGGSIAPAGTTYVREGRDLTLTITPDPGYLAAYLVVDGERIAPALTYTFRNVQGPHTIQAVFVSAAEANPGTGSAPVDRRLTAALVLLSGLLAAVCGWQSSASGKRR